MTQCKLIYRILAIASLFLILSACDPAHLSYVTLSADHTQVPDSSEAQLQIVGSPHVARAIEILNDIAAAHGLTRDTAMEEQELSIRAYGIIWGTVEHGHPNALWVILYQPAESAGILEVEIFEWLAFRQTEFGRKIQDYIEAQFRAEFGAELVRVR